MVSKLGQINVAYILFESVTDIEDLVAVLLSMKRQVYFIRTKCDNIDKDCELTLEQEIQRDIGELKKISVLDPVVFATSKKGGFDNQKLTLHILS
jgi:GTP-binding protein EngB required for normal cell division